MAPRFAYLHGFASSSLSTKGQALRRFFAGRGLTMHTPDLNHPSFAALTYSGMLAAFDRLDRELSEAELASGQEQPSRWRLIGSSMGGFVASRWAELHPERVERAEGHLVARRVDAARPAPELTAWMCKITVHAKA